MFLLENMKITSNGYSSIRHSVYDKVVLVLQFKPFSDKSYVIGSTLYVETEKEPNVIMHTAGGHISWIVDIANSRVNNVATNLIGSNK